jgi:hypothetical protein
MASTSKKHQQSYGRKARRGVVARTVSGQIDIFHILWLVAQLIWLDDSNLILLGYVVVRGVDHHLVG